MLAFALTTRFDGGDDGLRDCADRVVSRNIIKTERHSRGGVEA